MLQKKLSPQQALGISDFGDGPESRYIVRSSLDAELQTGCFVLRPTKEKSAFIALKLFYSILDEKDPRREPLLKWLKRLDALWKLGLEDISD